MIKSLVLDFNGVVEIMNLEGQRLLNQEIINMALDARGRGIKLAILSNYSSELRQTLKNYNIDTIFDAIILSGECGYKKPEKEIFEIARNALGVEYKEMLVIDDSEKTFKFQQELGYHKFLYQSISDISKIISKWKE